MPISTELVLALAGVIGTIAGAGMKGLWVWGRELKKAERDANFWRDIALKSMGLTDIAIEVAQKKKTDDG